MGYNWTMRVSVMLVMISVAAPHRPNSSAFSTSDGQRLLATTQLLRLQNWHHSVDQYNLTTRTAAPSDISAYKMQRYNRNKNMCLWNFPLTSTTCAEKLG